MALPSEAMLPPAHTLHLPASLQPGRSSPCLLTCPPLVTLPRLPTPPPPLVPRPAAADNAFAFALQIEKLSGGVAEGSGTPVGDDWDGHSGKWILLYRNALSVTTEQTPRHALRIPAAALKCGASACGAGK